MIESDNAVDVPRGRAIEVRPGRTLDVAHSAGDGAATIFFIHGAGGNKHQWRLQWQALTRRGFGLVAWDALGHGRSPQPHDPRAYAGQAFVADAATIIRTFGEGRTILVAHSFGARVALRLAADDPTIAGLVLIGPAPLRTARSRRLLGVLMRRLPSAILECLRPALSRSFRRRAWHAETDPALIEAEGRATRGNRLHVLQAMLSDPPTITDAELRNIEVPVMILASPDDGLVPLASARTLARRLPNATLRLLTHCAHQIMLEQPQHTTEAIVKMVQRTESRRDRERASQARP